MTNIVSFLIANLSSNAVHVVDRNLEIDSNGVRK